MTAPRAFRGDTANLTGRIVVGTRWLRSARNDEPAVYHPLTLPKAEETGWRATVI